MVNHMVFFLEVSMNRLREIRVVKRITQFQLRLFSGIHQSKIAMIENGLVVPSENEKHRLTKALQVSPEDIWGRKA
jgi:transcriptional regulator with XRE-family HTH domain